MICFSCSDSEFDSSEELNAYILSPKNNLTQVAEVNGYTVGVSYRPTDLLVHQEIGAAKFDSSKVNMLRKKYKKYYYFILSLSKNSREALHQIQGSAEQYSELVQTLSFRMGDYVSLTTLSNDTIPVEDYVLNRTFGLNQSTDVLFVFNREKAKGKKWVQFNLQEFGLGVGRHRFRFSSKLLDAAPGIDFKNMSASIVR